MSEHIEGKFLAKAASYNFGASPKKGTPGCAILWEITKGEHAGTRVPWSGWFTEGTAERTLESLQHAGYNGDDPSTIVVEQLPDEVEIVVKPETFETDQGQQITVSKVQWVNRAGGGGVQLAALGKAESISFKEKMKGLVLAQRAKKPTTKNEQESFDHGANAPQLPATGTSGRSF